MAMIMSIMVYLDEARISGKVPGNSNMYKSKLNRKQQDCESGNLLLFHPFLPPDNASATCREAKFNFTLDLLGGLSISIVGRMCASQHSYVEASCQCSGTCCFNAFIALQTERDDFGDVGVAQPLRKVAVGFECVPCRMQ